MLLRSEAEIREKIAQLQSVLDMVDEPHFISFLSNTKRVLEWVVD